MPASVRANHAYVENVEKMEIAGSMPECHVNFTTLPYGIVAGDRIGSLRHVQVGSELKIANSNWG